MSNSTLVYNRIAECRLLQDPSKRLECLRKLYVETHENGSVAFAIGGELYDQRRFPEALKYFKAAESRPPTTEDKVMARNAQKHIHALISQHERVMSKVLMSSKVESDNVTVVKSSFEKGFIVDPSLISHQGGIDFILFLKAAYKSDLVVIPTRLYSTLRERNFDAVFPILFEWEQNLHFKDYEWLKSSEYAEKVASLLNSCVPVSEVLKLGQDPPIIDEIAIELRDVASKFGFPVISASKSLFGWLRKNGVAVLSSISDDYKNFKTNFRKKYREFLGVRLTTRGIQAAPNIFITYVLTLRPETVQQPWNIIFPVAATAAGNVLFQAVVIDP